jgi:phage/plasmid-associated DNA primase
MERQQTGNANCMMIDIDGDYAGTDAVGRASAFAERNFVSCSRAIARSLYDIFDWDAYSAELHGREPGLFAPATVRGCGALALGAPNIALEGGVHIAYFVRPATKASKNAQAAWRDGMHIYVFVRAKRAEREHFFQHVRKRLVDALARAGDGRLINPDTAFDMGTVSAPIALYGSPTKVGGTVYRFAALHHLRFGRTVEGGAGEAPEYLSETSYAVGFSHAGDGEPFLSIAAQSPTELPAPAWELSLNWERAGGVIKKHAPPVRPEHRAALPLADAVRTAADLLAERGQTAPLVVYWKNMIDLIDVAQVRRNEWRNLVYAIASLGPEWELLGRYFSERATHRDGRTRVAEFEKLWPEAQRGGETAITWRSILYVARRDAPEQYYALQQNSNMEYARQLLMANGGQITHAAASQLLHHMYRERYITLKPEMAGALAGRGGDYVWLEMGYPGRDRRLRRPGDDWKWNVVGSRPDSLVREIKTTLAQMVGQIIARAAEQAEERDDDQRDLLRQLKNSRRSLGTMQFVAGVLRSAADDFVDYGFALRLNRDPNFMGVANGVLEVRTEVGTDGQFVRLLANAAGAAISKYSVVAYVPAMADPHHPARVRLRRILGDIFRDRLDWIMKYASLALRGGRKTNAFMVILVGGGNNGKSVFLELMRLTFGHFGYKAPVSILTSMREKPNEANSAYALMAECRFVYFSEPEGDGHDANNALRMARLKEMLSPEVQSTRNLREGQLNFVLEAILIASTNNDFTVRENNYSVWKRLVRVCCDTRFVPNPHPDDPRERLEDPSISDAYINDPQTQSAFLAELIDHFEVLQRDYNGDIKRVPNAQVRADTQYFRETQDVIHQFIRRCVVRRASPAMVAAAREAHEDNEADDDTDPRLADEYDQDPSVPLMLQMYNQWRGHNGIGGRVPETTGRREFADSEIGRYLYKNAQLREHFRGLRVLGLNESAAPGETPVMTELEVSVSAGARAANGAADRGVAVADAAADGDADDSNYEDAAADEDAGDEDIEEADAGGPEDAEDIEDTEDTGDAEDIEDADASEPEDE